MVNKYSTATKMALAAIAAFLIYYPLHLAEGYWAVISIAAITQFGLSKTLTKAFMRTIGTVLGAVMGFVIAYVSQGNIILIMSLFLIFILLSSYVAIQETVFTYAAIVTGLTTVIVISSTQLTAKGALFSVAVDRSFEVLLGIGVLLIINLIFSIFYRLMFSSLQDFGKVFMRISAELKKLTFDFRFFRAAVKIALACLMTFAVWLYFRQPGGFWATVSCLLIMEESVHNTQIRSGLRFIATTGAAFFAAIAALLIGDHIWLRLIALGVAFFVCGYIIGSRKKYASLGNTMGIAIAIMLLLDPGVSSSFHVILDRFLNVTFGIAVGVFITTYLWPKAHNAGV